jgi:hypothetical protein
MEIAERRSVAQAADAAMKALHETFPEVALCLLIGDPDKPDNRTDDTPPALIAAAFANLDAYTAALFLEQGAGEAWARTEWQLTRVDDPGREGAQ